MYACMYVCIHVCIDVLCDCVEVRAQLWEMFSLHVWGRVSFTSSVLLVAHPLTSELHGHSSFSLCSLSLGIMGLQPCHTSSLYHRDLFCGPWGSKLAHLAFAATVFTVELSCWTPFLRQVLSLTWSLSIGLSSVNKLQGAPCLHCSPLAQGHQQQAFCCFSWVLGTQTWAVMLA